MLAKLVLLVIFFSPFLSSRTVSPFCGDSLSSNIPFFQVVPEALKQWGGQIKKKTVSLFDLASLLNSAVISLSSFSF
jgi:hypothetical protein